MQAGSAGRRSLRILGYHASACAVFAAVWAPAYRSRHRARTLSSSARMVCTRCVRETIAGASAAAAEASRITPITARERAAPAASLLTRLAVAGHRPEHLL